MTDDIRIRPAQPADAGTLIELRGLMLIELGADDPARLAELARVSIEWVEPAFAEGRLVGWIAERDSRVIGGASMTLTTALPQYRSLAGKVASVYGLYVVPAERGRGIATRLVSMAVSHAREQGYDLVTLHAADKARPLYERLGFVATSEMRLELAGKAPYQQRPFGANGGLPGCRCG
jgi:GNAT superfamily N-acetyltransferase